jgi:hypothetical protein
MAKCGSLRCVGLDIVEGRVKTVDVFDKSISGGKAELIFQNARCKERTRKLCVFRDGIYLSRLVITKFLCPLECQLKVLDQLRKY